MENLSIHKVVRDAPAARPRRNAAAEGLIDTTKFLRYVKDAYDFEPVVAVQGSAHRDAYDEAAAAKGRHLVVATGRSGLSLVLLNSHVKDRRAHIGVGFTDAPTGATLIGPSMPIQRWHGFEEPCQKLLTSQTSLNIGIVAGSLHGTPLVRNDAALFAKSMSGAGYLPTVEARPSVAALLEGFDVGNFLDLGLHVLKRMREGNLESSVSGGRRIKRINRPDGLFHAGMVAMDLLMKVGHRRNTIPREIDFGPLEGRLVRP